MISMARIGITIGVMAAVRIIVMVTAVMIMMSPSHVFYAWVSLLLFVIDVYILLKVFKTGVLYITPPMFLPGLGTEEMSPLIQKLLYSGSERQHHQPESQ
jgi:hypothetical protein